MRIVSRILATLSVTLLLGYASANAETMDELHKEALKEGGTINFYGTLAQINAATILPMFEKRFPGMKINHVDATSDKLVARAVAEARGGRTIGDVFQTPIENVVQMHEQGLLIDKVPPEAAEYPAGFKGPFWVGTDMQFFIMAWNTNLVKKGQEPQSFDDLADPKWKNKIIAEPRDLEMALAFSKYKFKSEEKAIALLKKIAANNVEFHKGHSQLAELLVAGQAAVCFTCYSHHYPKRIRKGAPVGYSLNEGVASMVATGVFKNAPHPKSAWLFARWVVSRDGQKAWAIGGRTPSHPKVEPKDKTRTKKIYAISADDVKDFPKYEKIWKEIFGLR